MSARSTVSPVIHSDRDQSTRPDARITRFGATERLLHWWTVTMVAIALLTGLSMGSESEGGPTLNVHVGSVVLIGVGILVALLFSPRAVTRSAVDLFMFNRTDAAWLASMIRRPFRRHPEIQWGKFNTGQKVLAWSLLGTLGALIVTGVNSWSSGGDASGPHAAAAVLALILLGAHVFMAVVNPSTRPALPGMVFGHVRRSWAASHHPGWLAREDLKRAESFIDPPSRH